MRWSQLPQSSIHGVGVIGDGYPEDGKTIFQDIGASKAPQSDCPAASAGSPSDCSARPAADCSARPATDCSAQPAADCANQPAADCSPKRHRQDTDETIVPEHYSRVISAIMYSVTCPLALFMK